MVVDLLHLFLSLIFSALLYPFWIRFVYRFQMGERVREDGPKTHLKKQGTPTMGGLVFIFTTAVITFLFNRSRTQTLFPLFIASLAGLFGLVEDFTKVFSNSVFFDVLLKIRGKVKSLFETKRFILIRLFGQFVDFWRAVGSNAGKGFQTYEKFLFQFSIGGFVAFWTHFKLGWDYIWFPLIGNVHLGLFYPIFIILLFIVILNSVAFTDGLDGLAGGLSLFTFCGFWAIAPFADFGLLRKFSAIIRCPVFAQPL